MKSVMILAALVIPTVAFAQALPYRKPHGETCGTGYYASGSFCAPFRDAKPAFAKRAGETCPTGFYSSGSSCVAFR